MTRHRLAVARLWYEANSFNPVPGTLAAFQAREWLRGEAAFAQYAGTATEMGAAVDFLRARPDWQGQFLRCTSAVPGGVVAQVDLDAIIEEIVAGVAAGSWDAVYLSLHGALIGSNDDSPDHTLLAAVRAAVGPDIPIAASFDMHACLDPRIAPLLDVMTGYRTYPHVDMYETAARALALLERRLAGEIDPRVSLRPVPMLPPSHEMRTDAGPMADLVAQTRAREGRDGIHDATVFGGFAYADTEHARTTICLCHERRADVSGPLDQLAAAALARHADFLSDLPTPEAGIARAMALLDDGTRWPVAVVDPADNPLSGGVGDTTALLAALIESGTDLPAVFCFFHDPALVARAHDLGAGAPIEARLGGRLDPGFGAPVAFSGIVERLTDGRFVNRGPMERGMPVALGRSAVLRAGALRVVICETCQSANDPGWCDLHGIDLGATALFCVKAKNHFRAGFAPLCGAIVTVDAPGPAPANLGLLTYRKVPGHFLAPQRVS